MCDCLEISLYAESASELCTCQAERLRKEKQRAESVAGISLSQSVKSDAVENVRRAG